MVEGAFSLLLQCGLWADLAHVTEGEAKERAELLLDLLTPVAKSYPSEMCCQTTSAAVQILGGAGYTTDFPVEQYYREARIHPIHEGTTGIHGLDLLGRKLTLHGGKGLQYLTEEIKKTIAEAKQSAQTQLLDLATRLEGALERVQTVTTSLLHLAKQDKELFLADATLYLDFFGIVTIAWQWLKQAIQAQKGLMMANSEENRNFYQGKVATANYFLTMSLSKLPRWQCV